MSASLSVLFFVCLSVWFSSSICLIYLSIFLHICLPPFPLQLSIPPSPLPSPPSLFPLYVSLPLPLSSPLTLTLSPHLFPSVSLSPYLLPLSLYFCLSSLSHSVSLLEKTRRYHAFTISPRILLTRSLLRVIGPATENSWLGKGGGAGRAEKTFARSKTFRDDKCSDLVSCRVYFSWVGEG